MEDPNSVDFIEAKLGIIDKKARGNIKDRQGEKQVTKKANATAKRVTEHYTTAPPFKKRNKY